MKTDQDLSDLEYLLYFPNTPFFLLNYFASLHKNGIFVFRF